MKKAFWIAGAAFVVAIATPSGARAERAAATPTFNKDVAPILFSTCVECHRPGQVAPMSLLSFTEARPWARAIKTKVAAREMPPWFADPRYGKFRNARSLSQEQIDTIAAWVDAGAPEGDGAAPTPPEFPEGWSTFMSRPPDAVVEMPIEMQVPGEGEIPNFTIWGPNPFKEDKLLEAVELQPSNRRVTHHSSAGSRALPAATHLGRGPAWRGGPLIDGVPVYADGRPYTGAGDANEVVSTERTGVRPGQAVQGGDVNEAEAQRNAAAQAAGLSRRGFSDGSAAFESLLLFYVPGGGFQKFRPGMSKRLRQSDQLTWGLHYTMTGKPETDRHRLGVWFQQVPTTHEVVTTAVTGTHIVEGKEIGSAANRPVIPPGADDWKITGITALKDDVTLSGLWPHMHLRGKDMTFTVVYPDGREEIILSVPRYDFNWQVQYEFEQPLKLPAGTVIKAIAHYDNSVKNRYNPAPDKEVYWSEQSWDEMFLPFLELTVDKNDLTKEKKPTEN